MLAHDISTHTGIECQFEDRHSADIKDRTDAMQIFRIVQEAVNNAVKHAQANHIKITLQGNKKDFEVAVSDDGCGFKMDQVNDESMGIRIMHYRTSIIGFHLEIESSPGKGTTVRCRR
jgi:signal transduction histidine kinase